MDAVRIDELDTPCLTVDLEPVGICVAKLGEAEVMLAAGIDDVLITTELAGAIKARRLARLIDRWPDARVSVVVDSCDGASALDSVLPRPLDTLIDVNVGQDVLPSHIDTTVNLHDALHAHRSGRIETTWAVAARGKVQ
jgi:D-serine deaminase-like pyridoxal phosphate-dependent protein